MLPKVNQLWCLTLLAVVAAGQEPAHNPAGYSGSKACEACHPMQAASHAQTGHARALKKAEAGSPGEWAFGAGKKAVTYVSRDGEQHYIEHGLSYYTARKAMGITPGHENAKGRKYRTLDPSGTALRCFRCHTTGPISLASNGAIHWTEAGVQCEACHGPGSEHLKKPTAATIQNPRRFSPAELNDYCGDCHRTAADITDWGLSWNSRHEPAFLSQSRCFEKAAVSCLTCHSAHTAAETNSKHYDAKCSGCHANIKHRTTLPAASSCVSCHMPSVPTNASLRFTNHWIGIYDKARPMTPVGRSVKTVARTGVRSPASPEGLRAIYELAHASDRGMFLKSLGDSAGAVEALSEAVRTRGDAVDLENLAKLYGELRRNGEAKELLQRATQSADPEVAARSWSVLASMEPERAREFYEKAVASSKSKDFKVIVMNNLSFLHRENKDNRSAEKILRQALVLDPDNVGVLSNLGSMLHSSGRILEAERLERHALAVLLKRTGPRTAELATVSTNLGDLLLSKGQPAEALTHFRRALAVDQAVYGANHPELFIDLMNLGMLLKGTGISGEAQTILQQALAIAEQHFGPNSQEARAARDNLAVRKP
ncbi:MAG: tetratricopeptide repeat protein [Acidobacteria bacterium]|nr:tetratricopeptide repeat protein [Acidobacteriota bacterium]